MDDHERIAKRAVEIAEELRRALPVNTDFGDGWQQRYLARQNERYEKALEMARREATANEGTLTAGKQGGGGGGDGVTVVCGSPPPKPPCAVCGTPYEKHGTAPTCASHDYTDGGHITLVVRTAGVLVGDKQSVQQPGPDAATDAAGEGLGHE